MKSKSEQIMKLKLKDEFKKFNKKRTKRKTKSTCQAFDLSHETMITSQKKKTKIDYED